ncbi:MAG: CRISPR system precrRNA processing endoribonuclease RAMP protein Cas6, partial [Caldilineaceae bacterium]|nr:CRISPR system precrRNA processing endoribonuclease RAMP protein Cas6 [Caldilineaceae bacterium]
AFHEFMGSALRGALVAVLRRTFCPEWRAERTDAAHRAICPVCRLLALENDTSIPGDVRRPYALIPPPDTQPSYAVGDEFAFGLTLFGDSIQLLPYLLLTLGGMGEVGIGRRLANGKRGTFTVRQLDAINPFTGDVATMMAPGERMVQPVTVPVTHAHILAAATTLAAELAAHDNRLWVDFRTPLRLTPNHQRATTPDFFAFAKAAVLRVADLSAQYGEGRPTLGGEPLALKRDLYGHADAVQLLHNETHWWDLQGYSSRLQQKQVLGGLVGRACYQAPDWRPLLPWLLWGMSAGVGRNIVKGCGIYQLLSDADLMVDGMADAATAAG